MRRPRLQFKFKEVAGNHMTSLTQAANKQALQLAVGKPKSSFSIVLTLFRILIDEVVKNFCVKIVRYLGLPHLREGTDYRILKNDQQIFSEQKLAEIYHSDFQSNLSKALIFSRGIVHPSP